MPFELRGDGWEFSSEEEGARSPSGRKVLYRGTLAEGDGCRPAVLVAYGRNHVESYAAELASLVICRHLGVGPGLFRRVGRSADPRVLGSFVLIEEDAGVDLESAVFEGAAIPEGEEGLSDAGGTRDEQNRAVARGLVGQLANLHAAGVRHGDAKLANACVRRTGGAPADLKAVLIDFETSSDAAGGGVGARTEAYDRRLFEEIPRSLGSAGPADPDPLQRDLFYLAADLFQLQTGKKIEELAAADVERCSNGAARYGEGGSLETRGLREAFPDFFGSAAGGLDWIRERLQPCAELAGPSEIALSFAERPWLAAALRAELDGANGCKGAPVVLLTGGPGTGKTAFVASEFALDGAVSASVFCHCDDPRRSSADEVAASVAFQLACAHEGFRRALAGVLRESNREPGALEALSDGPRWHNECSLFTHLVALPAARSATGGDLLVLLDGLDEVGSGLGGAAERKMLVSDIAALAQRNLPSGLRVRFVVTSRNDAELTAAFEGFPKINLDERAECDADIRGYVSGRVDDVALAEEITKKAGNSFLFAKLACNTASWGAWRPGAFPAGLTALYGAWFERAFDQEPDEERRRGFARALGVLVASEEPVPAATLDRALGGNGRGRESRAFRRAFSQFLTAGADGALSPFHKSLSDWLASENAPEAFVDEKEESRGALLNACLAAYGLGVQAMNAYEVAHLLPLLHEFKKDHSAELDEVLADAELAKRCREEAETGTIGRCEAYLLCALEIYRRLSENVPECCDADLAATCEKLGNHYCNWCYSIGAEPLLCEALEIYRRLAASDPETYDDYVAMACNNLGLLYSEGKERRMAEPFLCEALEIYRRLAASDHGRYDANVAAVCNNLGFHYSDAKKYDDAEPLLCEALEIYRCLAASDPETYDDCVAMACVNLGDLYAYRSERSRAESLHRVAFEVRRRLATSNPERYAVYVDMPDYIGDLYFELCEDIGVTECQW